MLQLSGFYCIEEQTARTQPQFCLALPKAFDYPKLHQLSTFKPFRAISKGSPQQY